MTSCEFAHINFAHTGHLQHERAAIGFATKKNGNGKKYAKVRNWKFPLRPKRTATE